MRRYFPRQRDGTFAGRTEEIVQSAGLLRPPDGGLRRRSERWDDLLGEVLRMLRLLLSTSKEQAGTVPPSGIGWICTANWYERIEQAAVIANVVRGRTWCDCTCTTWSRTKIPLSARLAALQGYRTITSSSALRRRSGTSQFSAGKPMGMSR